ncbi:uncharacterized protein LOC127103015 [Lathyrus oleraceus]|uniref:uncharacterized protein LOC127103015 n=1 Tax=Pisum sativum TaxID=3888 RepID=UPI0021D11841|nr:uncharacterized protein LOC127103015 [Pisum sativum]
MVAKGSTCIKFESGLHPEIKQDVGYQEIRRFPMLVNKYRIYDEDIMARFVHYKSLSEKKGKNQYHSKSYNASTDKGKHRASNEKKLSMGDTSTSIKCGKLGHHANECKNKLLSISLIAIIHTGAIHSFIFLDCAERLGLKLSAMVGNMVIDTRTNGLVTMSWVWLNFPLKIYGSSFSMCSMCCNTGAQIFWGPNFFVTTKIRISPLIEPALTIVNYQGLAEKHGVLSKSFFDNSTT